RSAEDGFRVAAGQDRGRSDFCTERCCPYWCFQSVARRRCGCRTTRATTAGGTPASLISLTPDRRSPNKAVAKPFLTAVAVVLSRRPLLIIHSFTRPPVAQNLNDLIRVNSLFPNF